MTSLRDQLKKLATPATKQLRVDIRKRPSLIYDPTEAAKIDFSIHFERAKEAFDHLCNIDASLKRFEDNLFAEDSVSYEPSVQDPDVHHRTGKRLQKFLMKISPLLQIPTLPLQALEWLVQRFQVHLYHPDDVIRCVMPYHETALFPKFLQLLDLDAHDNRRWAWLKGISDKGIPLMKDELLLACSRDQNIVLFISHSLEISLKVNRKQPQRAQSSLVLFTQVALGLLTRFAKSEAELGALLVTVSPTLETGLGPVVLPGQKAASFLLLQTLCSRARLQQAVARRWLDLVLAHPMPGHPEASLMLTGLLVRRHGLQLSEADLQRLQELEEQLGAAARQESHLQAVLRRLRLEEEPEVMEVEEEEVLQPAVEEEEEERKESPAKKPKNIEKRALKKKKKSLAGAELIRWLLMTALGGSEREDSEVARVYALSILREQLTNEDEETCEALSKQSVVPYLLLLLLHASPRVRELALSCLNAVRSRLVSPQTSGDGRSPAKVLRKLLKIADGHLLAGDHLLLQQAPYNLRVLTECLDRLGPDQLWPREAPEEAVERRAWLFAASKALQLLDAAAAGALLASHPRLGSVVLDLLSAHRPGSSEGGVLWAAWQPQILTALPPDVRDRGLDLCLEAAPAQLAKMKLTVQQVKRLLTGLLPKKGAMSARDLILRKRSLGSRSTTCDIEALFPPLLGLLEVLEDQPWSSSSDAPPWSLVPTFMDCLSALTAADPTGASPKRQRRPSLSEEKKANRDSSDSESEVIADYSDEEPSSSSSRALAVRRVLAVLLNLLRAIPEGAAGSDVALEPLLDCLAGAFDRQVRQSALLVVSEAARLRPALLLHNLLPLLTFMRWHVFPLDDAFTLQVIERVLDSVVPAFIRAGTSAQAPGEVAALRVMTVLADSFHHMPPHRRLPLFSQLGKSVASPAAGACFGGTPWPVLVLLADRLSKAGGRKRLSTEGGHFLCRLLSSFPALVQLRSASALLRFLRTFVTAAERAQDPPKSPPPTRRRTRSRSSFCEDAAVPLPVAEGPTGMVLELVTCGPLLDRLALAHALTAALGSHLASPAFLSAFVNCPRGGEELTAGLEGLLDEILQLAQLSADRVAEEGWRGLLSASAQLLDKVHAFLPFGQHLAVVLRLCGHPQPSVQRKALELLHGRLSALPDAAGGPQALTALSPLLLRAADVVESSALAAGGPSVLRQTALLCGKELARLLASDQPERFGALLRAVFQRAAVAEERLLQGGPEVEEEACAYLLTAELLQGLPEAGEASRGVTERLMPQLEVHRQAAGQDTPPPALQMHRTAAAALLVASAKAAACGWERARLQALLVGLAGLEADWPEADRASLVRLRAARRALAEGATSKVLLGALGGAMRQLGAADSWRALRPLLLLLERHVERLDDAGAARLQQDRLPLLCKLCVTALGVRQRAGPAQEQVEDAAIFALLAVLRRLEEKAREEMMGMLFEWSRGAKLQAGRGRQIAFFRLCDCLASREPVLLVASCMHLEIFDFATAILTSLSEEGEKVGEKEVDVLLRSLLSALTAFFKSSASAGSLTVDETSQALIPAVARALDVTGSSEELYKERSSLFLLPCLAALAEACGGDEALLRPLCLEVCNRTKHASPHVRAASLRAITAFSERLGSVFESSLLQDALPFMAECLEDDDSGVQDLAFEMCERIRRQCGGDVDF